MVFSGIKAAYSNKKCIYFTALLVPEMLPKLHPFTMRFSLSFLLLMIGLSAYGQLSIPLFSNTQDSIQYAQIQAELQKAFASEPSSTKAQKVDSLFKLQLALRDKIIGYKTIYQPDKSFTQLQDILDGKVSAATVSKLSIANNASRKIPGAVRQCKNLTEIELVNTRIKKLPKSLDKLANLKAIYIYNNVTKTSLKLKRNTHVTQLLLRGMTEQSLPSDYANFAALEELNLSQNIGLSHFPNVYQNSKLKKINLIDNQVTLDDLKPSSLNLEELILQRNKITRVPAAIGNLTELKKLSFNYNNISSVEGIDKLQKLEELSFYQNKLTEIPAGVYALTNLKSIDLYHNEISKIDDRIADMRNLEILYLSNNQLSTLPETVGNLSKLRELYLSNNKLFVLPGSLRNLTNLTTLRVNQNKLSDFPEFIFDIPAIENLDVSSNSIRLIPEKVAGLSTLKIFIFGDNPVNKEEVNLQKIIETLQSRGTIVHQNIIAIKTAVEN